MNIGKVCSLLAAAGTLVAGLYARQADAVCLNGCSSAMTNSWTEEIACCPFGDCSFGGGEITSLGAIQTNGTKVLLVQMHANMCEASAYGYTSSGWQITDCHAVDFTDNGASEADVTGCAAAEKHANGGRYDVIEP
jgi:hypothetical protein